MRKRMQQRVALFLSFAMAFTSIDSSVLVSASDVTGIVSEETHDHASEEAFLAEKAKPDNAEDTSISGEVESITEADLGDAEEDVILGDLSESEGEQVIGDEPETSDVVEETAIESATEVAAPEENTEGVTISNITGAPVKEEFIAELDTWGISNNTMLEITYSDGSVQTYTIHNDQFVDKYGTVIPFYLKNTEDGNTWRYGYGNAMYQGTWDLVCEVNGEAVQTDVTYNVTNVADAEIPVLELGTVSIHSDNNYYNWYQFTAPETGKFFFEKCGGFSVYKKTSTGVEGVSCADGNFKATEGEIYYLGFQGTVWNQSTGQFENDWQTEFARSDAEITSITNIIPAKSVYLANIETYLVSGTEATITYANGESKTVTWNGNSVYSDGRGNTISMMLKNEDNSESYYQMQTLKVGDYAAFFTVDGKEIGNSGYVYHVKNVEDADVQDLTLGENEINSSSLNDLCNWYQFTAPAAGKYRINRYSEFRVYTGDGSWVSATGGAFKATEGTTYYLGFRGSYDGSSYTWTANLSAVTEITEITDIVPGKTESMAGLNYLADGTTFMIHYSDGSSEEAKIVNGTYTDSQGNHIEGIPKRENDDTEYSCWQAVPAGMYAVSLRLDGTVVASTDYIYHVVKPKEMDLPELNVGSNQITSGQNNNYNWYRFTAPTTGKYWLDKISMLAVYVDVKDELQSGSWSNNFQVEAGKTYYIGFRGSSWDPETEGQTYEWITNLQLAKEITKISDITPKRTEYVSGLDNMVSSGTVFNIYYSDGSVKRATVYSNFYNDGIGNGISMRLISKADGTEYWDWSNLPAGKYALAFYINEQQVAKTDFVYQVKSIEEVGIGELAEGENQIVSSTDNNIPNWYQFVPQHSGNYRINPVGGLCVRKKTENGIENINNNGSTVFMTAGTTYYLGFLGMWNGKYEWTVTVEQVPIITDIQVMKTGKEKYIADLDQGIAKNTELQINYDNEKTASVKVTYGSSCQDTYGNYIYLELTKGNKNYNISGSVPAGTYTLKCVVNDNQTYECKDVYQVADISEIDLPELKVGTTEITSSEDYDNPNWYRFTSPKTKRYVISKYSGIKVKHLSENGILKDVSVSEGAFRATYNQTYYIGFYYGIWDDDEEEDIYTWTTELRETNYLTGIWATAKKTKFYAGYEQNHVLLSNIKVRYDGGNLQGYTEWGDWSNIDGQGNGCNVYLTDEEEEQYDVGEALSAGTYTVHIQYREDSSVQDDYIIQVENEPTPFLGDEVDVTELSLDEKYRVSLDEDKVCEWFSYTPEKDRIVQFQAFGRRDTYGELYDASGNKITESDEGGERNNFSIRETLEAGQTYYFKARLYRLEGEASFTVSLTEQQSIQSLEVVEHDLNSVYLRNGDLPEPNVLLKATYSNGESDTFYKKDKYNNEVWGEVLDASGNQVDTMEETGTYTYQVRYGDEDAQTVKVGEFQVVSLADYANQVVEEDQEQQIDAEDTQVMRYQFTVTDAGIYQLNANVSFKNLKVYDTEENEVKLSRHRNGYTCYATLQAGTYYVVADLDRRVDKLTVSVKKTILPNSVEAVYSGETLIAGLDSLDSFNIATRVEYTDDTQAWIYGEDADSYGNHFEYEVKNPDEEYSEWGVGDILPEGTYTVKPVVFRTGTTRWYDPSSENQMLEEVLTEDHITSTTVKAVKPDVSAMTPITVDQDVNVAGSNGRHFYAFTPETDGVYTFAYEGAIQGNTFFCDERDNGLRERGNSIKAKAGVTYIVVAEKYKDYQFRVVQKGTDTGETVTKKIQSVEICSEMEYVRKESVYENRDQLYLRVTYEDETTTFLDVPFHMDDWGEDTYDDYGNKFQYVPAEDEVIEEEDERYLTFGVAYPDGSCATQIPIRDVKDAAIEVTTENAAEAEAASYFKFVPEETGEYIFKTTAQKWGVELGRFTGNKSFSDRNGYETNGICIQQAIATLQRGKTYYFSVTEYRENNSIPYTLSVSKVGKRVTDLKIVEVPDGYAAYAGLGVPDMNWLKAEVTYSDGSKEIVTEGKPSDTGRALWVNRRSWINTNTYRVEVQYGNYRAHVDLPVKAWDYTGVLRTGIAADGKAGEHISMYSFTPDENDAYRFGVTGIKQYAFDVYNSETQKMIISRYGTYTLEAGTTYNVAVYNYYSEENEYTVTVNKAGTPEEHEHEYVDQTKNATCTEPGYTQKVCSICGAVQEESRTEIPALGHKLTKTEAKEATCTEAGNNTYWTCATCGKVYADENATTETTVKEQQIAALGHRLTKTEAKKAICTEAGNHEYWTCATCGKVFADENGKTETTAEDQVIAALGHKLTKTEAKEATCTEAGNHEYWTCETCEKVFSDAEGTIETTAEAEVIAAIGHKLMKVEAKEATCEAAGNHEYWICVTCGKVFADENANTETTVEDQVIVALGHKLTKVEAKAATCEEAGNNEYWICETCGKAFADDKAEKATTAASEVISPLGHTWDVRVTKEATETEEGIQETYCTTCGTVQKTETIPMLGHRMGDWIVTKEPTCTEEGSQYRECVYDKCTICTDGDRYRQEEAIPATGHDLKMVDENAATCTKAGNHAYWICQTCEKVYTDVEAKTETTIKAQVINATGHNYGEWRTTTDAKCEQAGEMLRICKNCGNREKTDIPALGHNYVTERKDATCEESGYEQERCSNCKQIKTGSYKRIPSLGHSYGDWVVVKKVTCTDYGEKIKTCRRCGDVYRMIINITGHWYEEESQAATCTEDGYTQKKCTICGDVKDYEVIKALGHDLGEKIYTQEADCTTNGRYTQICKLCGETVSGQEPMLGHDYREERKDATCTENGYTQLKCARCDAVKDYTLIAATGHTFSEWETITPSTCKEKGTAERTCSNAGCGEKETKDLDLAEHSWESKIIEPATATKEGVRALICSVCGTEKENSRTNIPMTAHQMGDWETVREATCTTDGLQQRTCIYQDCTLCVDGNRYTETRVIPALGHDLTNVEWVEDTPASCTKEGSRSKTCSRCKEKVLTEVIPMTAHDYVEQKTAPTCTTAGDSQLICTICHQVKEGSFTSIPATGHVFGLEDGYWEYMVEPTCTDQGLIRYSCQNANCSAKRISVVPTVPHTWNSEPTVKKEATCVAEGLQDIRCQNCSAVKPGSTQTIDQTGHNWRTTKTIDQKATCTTEGQKSIHCSVCDAIKEDSIESIPAIGHRYGTSVETRKATCTENGVQEQRCENCGEVVTVVEIEKLGHDMRLTDTMAATCEDDGVLTYTCSRCGRKQYKVQSALEHDWSEDTIIIDSTLDENGEEFRTCYRCGATNVVRVIPSKRQAEYIESINDYLKYGPTEADFQNVLGAMSQVDEEFVTSKQIAGVESSMSTQTAPQLDGNMIDGATIVGGTLALASVLGTQENVQLMMPALEQTADMPALMDSLEAKEQTGNYTLWINATEGGENPGEKYQDLSIVLRTLQVNGDTKEYTSVNTPIAFTLKLAEQIAQTNYKLVRVSETARATEEVAFERNEDGSITFTTKNFAGLRIVQGDCVDGNHNTQGATETITPATCTEPGKVTANCTVCGKEVLVKELAPLGHDYTVKARSTEATCTKNGTQTYSCSHDGCTETRQVTVLATGHKYNWTAVEGEEATCEKAGKEQQVCEKCSAVGDSRSVEALGHEYGEWTVTTSATCKADGVETRSCKHAGCVREETRTIPKTNEHTFVKDDSVQAESINCFLVEQEKCSVCGFTKKVTTGEPVHDWGEVQTEYATCVVKGMVFKTCKNCEETEIIKVLDIVEHKLSKTEAKTATCTEDGNSAYWTCEICSKVFKDEKGTQETTAAEQITKATGHKLTKTGAKAATCTENGNNAYWTCQTCGKVFADQNGKTETTAAAQVITKSGHKLTQTPAQAATCVAEGTRGYWTCGTCGKVFADQAGTMETTVANQILGKVAHTMGGYVETVHPTALAAGVKTRTCNVCGYAENAEVAKLISNVKLTTSKLPLQIKQKAALSKIVTGMAEGDYIASATSVNKKIATVDNKGNVKGVKAGKTTITLNFASGTSRTVTIVVQKKKVATSQLTVSERNVTLKVKGKRTLTALISPITSKDKVTYKTSNKKIATVSGKGVITAKKAGTAVITVKAGKKTVKVKVKVTK